MQDELQNRCLDSPSVADALPAFDVSFDLVLGRDGPSIDRADRVQQQETKSRSKVRDRHRIEAR